MSAIKRTSEKAKSPILTLSTKLTKEKERKIMTRRERLEMVIANTITDELIEECKAELVKMDEANAKRKEKVDPRKVENAEIMEKIIGIVSGSVEPMQIDPIVEGLGVEGLTRQRVSSLCTLLVKDGRLVSEDVKVKGKGKRKAYSIA